MLPQIKVRSVPSAVRWLFFVGGALLLAGCSPGRPLMPAPDTYQEQSAESVFSATPNEWKQITMQLMYVTDRKPETSAEGSFEYGTARSLSLAFGTVDVNVEGQSTWSNFSATSLDADRETELRMSLGRINELGRFPETPHPVVLVDGELRTDPKRLESARETAINLRAELERRLAQSANGEVLVYIHGYNNRFDDSVYVLAELWHFLGRRHVPVVYSWPAGHEGLTGMQGYNYDRESGEFTIYHLKQFLNFLSEIEDVTKVHIIAHSRGTDVAVSAVRELILTKRAEGRDPREELRVQNLVLAAPDLDFEVVLQRIVAERLETGVGQVTIYTSPGDKAIRVSEWLFGSIQRIGRLEPELVEQTITPEQIGSMQRLSPVHFIEYRGSSDRTGHGYFHSSPAVSSDLVILINDGAEPGSPGRPLQSEGANFWFIAE